MAFATASKDGAAAAERLSVSAEDLVAAIARAEGRGPAAVTASTPAATAAESTAATAAVGGGGQRPGVLAGVKQLLQDLGALRSVLDVASGLAEFAALVTAPLAAARSPPALPAPPLAPASQEVPARHWWELAPKDLIGRRVTVLWARGAK